VLGYRDAWRALGARVDDRRHREVLERFDQHVDHATRWRDTIVA
jgi:alpha-glucuronidase